MSDFRIENEIIHGKHLRESWDGTLWYWETPAGRVRWQRRLKMLISHITSEMNVLELGCAVGYFTKEIAKTNANITAIDISPDLLDVAKKNIRADNVLFKVDNAYEMSFEDNLFDTVIGSSILHHLDINRALKEVSRVLKPGGTIFFTEPNMLNPQIFIQKHIPFVRKIVGDSPDEIAFIRWNLKKLLDSNDFKEVSISPFDFLHPLTPSFLVAFIDRLGVMLEKVPFISEISGSLFVNAKK